MTAGARTSTNEPLPAGWSLRLDPATRRTDGGDVLVGGSPFRLLRLTAAGRRWLDRVLAGGAVGGGAGGELGRRLVDAALAHPVPGGGLPAADVVVVIPVRHDPDGLARTLASVGEGIATEVVPDDGDPPRGPGGARAVGIGRTEAPFLLLLDAGVKLPAGWLDGLLPHLDDPAVAAVAPRVASDPGDAPRWLAAYEDVRSSLDLGPVEANVRPGSRVTYVPTAALLVRRDALESVGGFDTDLHVGEDVDLVWRLVAAGWSVRYEPAVVARHPSRGSLRAWLRQRFRYGTSAAALAARHGRAVAPLQVSGWSAAAWGAVLAGHPLVGVGVAAGTTAALVPKLSTLARPGPEALRIAGLGNLWAGRSVADTLRRPWWPLALALGIAHRRSRPALLAAVVVPPAIEWRTNRPALDPVRYAALRLLDDLAYGAGVWAGCLRARDLSALRPAFTGPVRVSGGSSP